jgi:hypothetical protein
MEHKEQKKKRRKKEKKKKKGVYNGEEIQTHADSRFPSVSDFTAVPFSFLLFFPFFIKETLKVHKTFRSY